MLYELENVNLNYFFHLHVPQLLSKTVSILDHRWVSSTEGGDTLSHTTLSIYKWLIYCGN